jgi:hypothetical protein
VTDADLEANLSDLLNPLCGIRASFGTAICARTQSNVDARAEELRQSGARVLSLAVSLN